MEKKPNITPTPSIEVWFTNKNGQRECVDAKNLFLAKREGLRLNRENNKEIVIDVFKGEDDIQHYSLQEDLTYKKF